MRGSPIAFGNEATRQGWLHQCERQSRVQSAPFCVAPLVVIPLPGGRVLRQGDEVKASDLVPTPEQFEKRFNGRSGQALLVALVDAGYVTEARSDGPNAA